MKNFRIIVLAAVIIIVLSVLFYYMNFSDNSVSDDTSDWGAFSDYINPFVAFANLMIIAWLSIEVFRYNRKRDYQNDLFQKSIEKPVIVFKSLHNSAGGETWILRNIGKGAALNIKVGESALRNITWNIPLTKCYSLAQNTDLPLDWLAQSNVLCATYEDIFGNKYVSIGADDESHTRSLDNTYSSIIIEGFTFEKTQHESFNNLRSRRLYEARNNIDPLSTTSQSTNPNG